VVPDTLAAVMKSLLSTDFTKSLVTRAKTEEIPSPIARIPENNDEPRAAIINIASKSVGNAINVSRNDVKRSSHFPRAKPAMIPIDPPTSMPINTAKNPTSMAIRAPIMTRESWSRPKVSVPRKCLQLGELSLPPDMSSSLKGVHVSEMMATKKKKATRIDPLSSFELREIGLIM